MKEDEISNKYRRTLLQNRFKTILIQKPWLGNTWIDECIN